MTRISGQSHDSTLLEALGRRIRAERKRVGLSQEALADQAGIDRSHMGKIERGERNVTILNVERVARALSVELTQLMHVDGNAVPVVAMGSSREGQTTVRVPGSKKFKARFDDGQPRFAIINFELYPVIHSKFLSRGHYSEPFDRKPAKLRDEFLRCLKLRQSAVLAEDVPGSSFWHMQGLYTVSGPSMTAKVELTLGPLEAMLTEEWYEPGAK